MNPKNVCLGENKEGPQKFLLFYLYYANPSWLEITCPYSYVNYDKQNRENTPEEEFCFFKLFYGGSYLFILEHLHFRFADQVVQMFGNNRWLGDISDNAAIENQIEQYERFFHCSQYYQKLQKLLKVTVKNELLSF